MKDAVLFFFIQIVYYGLLTYNYRAIAGQHLAKALVSDGLIASFGFFTIQRIAHTEKSKPAWVGFVLGSLVGTAIGIYL